MKKLFISNRRINPKKPTPPPSTVLGLVNVKKTRCTPYLRLGRVLPYHTHSYFIDTGYHQRNQGGRIPCHVYTRVYVLISKHHGPDNPSAHPSNPSIVYLFARSPYKCGCTKTEGTPRALIAVNLRLPLTSRNTYVRIRDLRDYTSVCLSTLHSTL